MKFIPNSLGFLASFALVLLAVGCASSLLDQENVAVAADFKVITPSTPDQEALLQKLPAKKVTRIVYAGKTYYVLPDRKNNQVYVGGPKQYAAYQELRRKQKMDSSDSEAPDAEQMSELKAMEWSRWNNWAGVGVMGGPGWY